MRRAVELHWPALLAGSACAGLAASNWLRAVAFELSSVGLMLACVVVSALAATLVWDGARRAVAIAIVLATLGLSWGTLRLDALAQSPLAAEIGRTGRADVVVVGAARRTSWAVRVPAEVVAFEERRLRERVLLVLPLGRSPPRGAILETTIRITEPRAAEGSGFDEKAWLARQGIHVVARAGSWQQVGRRGGLAGLGDRLRDRIEAAVEGGTTGLRRALVLGVVLGEDEGLSTEVRDNFRASGLAHLLAVSGQNVAFIAGGIFGLAWLVRLPRVVAGGRAPRRDRRVCHGGRLAALGRSCGCRRSARLARVAHGTAERSLALPRGRRAGSARLDTGERCSSQGSSCRSPRSLRSSSGCRVYVYRSPTATRCPAPRSRSWASRLVCGLVTAPIVLVHFDSAPVYTVPANALAAPAMPLVLGLGLLAAAADPLSPDAAAALAWLAGWAAAWLELVARLVASLPGAQIGPKRRWERSQSLRRLGSSALRAVPVPDRSWTGARTRRRRPRVLILAGAWSLRAPPAWQPPAGFRVTFLDVGQGDSVSARDAVGSSARRSGPTRGGSGRSARPHGCPLALGGRPDASAAGPCRRRRGRPAAASGRDGARPGARRNRAGARGGRCGRASTRECRSGPSGRAPSSRPAGSSSGCSGPVTPACRTRIRTSTRP